MSEQKSVDETVQVEDPTVEELAEAGIEEPVPDEVVEAQSEQPVDSMPDWAVLPPDVKFPKGKRLTFVRFLAEWTDAPEKGDRWCILTNLTESDERMALKASMGEQLNVLSECAKACIRVVDGAKADRTRRAVKGAVHIFWHEIGEKCRDQIKNWYIKTHRLSREERQAFFASGIVIVTVG